MTRATLALVVLALTVADARPSVAGQAGQGTTVNIVPPAMDPLTATISGRVHDRKPALLSAGGDPRNEQRRSDAFHDDRHRRAIPRTRSAGWRVYRPCLQERVCPAVRRQRRPFERSYNTPAPARDPGVGQYPNCPGQGRLPDGSSIAPVNRSWACECRRFDEEWSMACVVCRRPGSGCPLMTRARTASYRPPAGCVLRRCHATPRRGRQRAGLLWERFLGADAHLLPWHCKPDEAQRVTVDVSGEARADLQ
jgi:hypothetical protein